MSKNCVITFVLQYVNLEECYLCGYLKIKGLTEEYPTLTTFFDGEIISKKYPFLTRKWEADEDVDKKHWVRIIYLVTISTQKNKNKETLDNRHYIVRHDAMSSQSNHLMSACFFGKKVLILDYYCL